jgi:hypothetical protein
MLVPYFRATSLSVGRETEFRLPCAGTQAQTGENQALIFADLPGNCKPLCPGQRKNAHLLQ